MELFGALPDVGARVDESVALVERLAFWSAVALPALHVPALLIVGLDRATAPALLALWAIHGLALVLGARYEPSDRRTR